MGLLTTALVLALAADPTAWDFRDGSAHGWKALNQIEQWKPSADGLRFHSRGEDPYLESPSFEHAASPYDELEVELSVSTGGAAQVFWKVADGAWYAEERSLPFRVDRAGEVVTVRLPVGEHPAWAGKVLQIRLDPCVQAADVCLVAVRVFRTPPPAVIGRWSASRVARDDFRVRLEATATESFNPTAGGPAASLRGPHAAHDEHGGDDRELRLSKCGDRASTEWSVHLPAEGVFCMVGRVGSETCLIPLAVPPETPSFPSAVGAHGKHGAYLASHEGALLLQGCGFFLYARSGEEWRLAGSGDFGLATLLESGEPDLGASGTWEAKGDHLRGTVSRVGLLVDVEVRTSEAGFDVRVVQRPIRPISYTGTVPGRHLSLARYRAGDGSFGFKQVGALLPGLEYLGPGEGSSSTLDCEGPEHVRLAPDRVKVTAPLMAVVGGGTVSGVMWDAAAPLTPLFDVPNRGEGREGSLIGLFYPPVPEGTPENRLRALTPFPHTSWSGKEFSFTLFALPGDDVTAAVRHFVEHRGLPELPKAPRASTEQAALSLAAFLDGQLYDDAVKGWGHCQEPSWGRSPAADVCYLLDLYADDAKADLAERLRKRSAEVLDRIPPAQRLLSGISHVRPEAVTLRLGGTAEALGGLKAAADAAVAEMRDDGSWKYEGKYARGHSSDTALGICAPRVIQLLRYVRLQGSSPHLEAAKKALARLDRFDVPRGAQTWEVPLHTPDILASAQAVEAFVLAYELTDDRAYLESAIRWAWTGVPFVYLWGDLPIMRYATIPVFGATNWQAPVWFGTPVQWCGLVYAWSLYRLAPYVPDGPWKKLADGITISGMQQQYPDGAKAGCFPDVFYLRAQQRAGPTINPAPLLVLQAFLEGRNPDLAQTRVGALRVVHLPGLTDVVQDVGKLSFTLPEGSRAQEVVVVGAMLQHVEGSVRQVHEGGSTVSVLSIPGPGRYEFSLIH